MLSANLQRLNVSQHAWNAKNCSELGPNLSAVRGKLGGGYTLKIAFNGPSTLVIVKMFSNHRKLLWVFFKVVRGISSRKYRHMWVFVICWDCNSTPNK